jgi:hypothetical protein
VSIYDVTPESLRQSAANRLSEADEHEAFADSIAGLERQAVDPIAKTRESILRAVDAFTATDRIYKHGVTLEVSFRYGWPDVEVEATTMEGCLVALLAAVGEWRRVEAKRLREMAAEMCEEAAEMDAKGRAA